MSDFPDFRSPDFLRRHIRETMAFYHPHCLDPAGGCGEEDLEQAYASRDVRAVLRSTSTDAGGATVRVDLVQGGDGPFGGDGWTDEQTFELVRDGDRWLLTGTPWPLYSCDPGPERAP